MSVFVLVCIFNRGILSVNHNFLSMPFWSVEFDVSVKLRTRAIHWGGSQGWHMHFSMCLMILWRKHSISKSGLIAIKYANSSRRPNKGTLPAKQCCASIGRYNSGGVLAWVSIKTTTHTFSLVLPVISRSSRARPSGRLRWPRFSTTRAAQEDHFLRLSLSSLSSAKLLFSLNLFWKPRRRNPLGKDQPSQAHWNCYTRTWTNKQVL